MTINVEAFHIKCGFRKSSRFCPIALALWPWVGGRIYVCEGGQVQIFGHDRALREPHLIRQLPYVAVAWLEKYDETGVGEPFSFEFKAAA